MARRITHDVPIGMEATLFPTQGPNMYSTILAYVIALLGLVMIVGGVATFVYIRSGPRPIAVRNYARAVTMICVGFAMGGIAQALRLLVAIAHAMPH
jgi:hypothetical protein